MKKMFFSLFCVILTCAGFADSIEGFWKTINEEGVAQSIIAVYPYEGTYYGRIIATFDDNGKIKDSIYKPVERAPGVIGHPYYSGLDIIWGMQNKGIKFKGKILDPQKGDIYNAEMWIDGNRDLVVRGKLLVFGRSQTWLSVTKKDVPNFKLPNLNTLVPKIPQT